MTKRAIEVFDDAAAFRLAVAGKKPKKPGASTGKASQIPRAPAGEGDQHGALERLAVYGISMRFDTGIGYYGWNAQTGWKGAASASYVEAIAAAEKEAKQL